MASPHVSVILPSRNEQFLSKTVDDICAKARGEIEVYAILDGWWPDRDWMMRVDQRVHFIHWTKARGQRHGYNAGAALAKGEFLMFLDSHCMLSEGFDVALADACQPDWLCVPTRLRLDAEKWEVKPGRRPINYLFLDPSNEELNGKLWDQKNRDRSLDDKRIDDLIACQGSCYFLPKALFERLGVFDWQNYGTFRKDPQEIVFKNWTSGGRCVRVKDAWYAHLHKGKKYGRGYASSKADWKKGDEYVKRWWANNAWDERQIVSLQDIVRERFADMPGWKDHTWAKGKPKRVDKQLPDNYQVLRVGDDYFTRSKATREGSKFWQEGRWNTFVKPLLPTGFPLSDQTFVEMGTNAGLYCKMASDHGYGRVIGIEKDRTPHKLGNLWRDAVGGNWTLLKRKLGGSFGDSGTFDIDELPVADVTLLSCFHYYIDLNTWLKYVDRLAAKTRHILVVSRPVLNDNHWRAQADLASVLRYFDGWELLDSVTHVEKENDPNPRDLYSVLLKSPIVQRVRINDTRQGGKGDREMRQAVESMASRVARQDTFDPMETAFAEQWKARKAQQWRERVLRRFVDMKVGVMESVRDDGLMDTLIVQPSGKLSDGGHRLALLKAMGHTSALVRMI